MGVLRETLERIAQKRMLRLWRRYAEHAQTIPIMKLDGLHHHALKITGVLHRFLEISQARLLQSKRADISLPYAADWAWRPDIFLLPLRATRAIIAPKMPEVRLSQDVKICHDCPISQITLWQNNDIKTGAYTIELGVHHFTGSWLSLVFDIPQDALCCLTIDHMFQLDLRLEAPSVYITLHVESGPDIAREFVQISPSGEMQSVKFDMAHTKINLADAQKIWLDIHFRAPQEARFVLHDLRFSRHPRAKL